MACWPSLGVDVEVEVATDVEVEVEAGAVDDFVVEVEV